MTDPGYQPDHGHGADALFRTEQARVNRGYGVVAGAGDECLVSLAESGDSIVFDVDAGEVRLADTAGGTTTVTIDPQQVAASENTSSEPRQDVIYVDSGGAAGVIPGQPGAPATDDTGAPLEYAGAPLPPPDATTDLEGVTLAVAWIPAGASSSSDLDAVDDIQDRRLFATVGAAGSGGRRFREDIPVSALDNGDVRSSVVLVPGGATIAVQEWGVAHTDDAGSAGSGLGAPPSGLRVEFVDPTGSVIDSANTLYAAGTPLFAETAGTEPEPYAVRLHNDTGFDMTDPEGATAFIEYEIQG